MSRHVRRAILLAGAVAILSVATVRAQSSASYSLRESAFNAGGDPTEGAFLSSPGFHIKLGAVGEGSVGIALAGPSFHMAGGFVSSYPPPGEATGVTFATSTSLQWNPESSAGFYDVYQDALGTLPGGFGSCLGGRVVATNLTVLALPASKAGFFYLVTAENRLGEEGTKGFRSNGAERDNSAPCP